MELSSHDPSSNDDSDGKTSNGRVKRKEKRAGILRKNPRAPKKPRSTFILFSKHMHNESKAARGDGDQGNVEQLPEKSKRVSQAWKSLSSDEQKLWKEKAENDKKRYEVEKAMFSGSWTLLPHEKKKTKKDATAPKRPMSAFLEYSKARRNYAIQMNPHVTRSKDISKVLGEMWRNASEEEKRPYVEKELKLRAEYNENAKKWRRERDEQQAKERMEREAAIQIAIDNGTSEELIQAAQSPAQSRSVAESTEDTLSHQNPPERSTSATVHVARSSADHSHLQLIIDANQLSYASHLSTYPTNYVGPHQLYIPFDQTPQYILVNPYQAHHALTANYQPYGIVVPSLPVIPSLANDIQARYGLSNVFFLGNNMPY
mmetsp:Transcript_16953/g.24138  ORF Transcript_16953/g.24138 Transcript_16953/m.24138 type:complete len:373 (+) Transcript_16953:101-1219(+)